MNRKLWALLAAGAILIAALCWLLLKPDQGSNPTEPSIPGLADSIFDEDSNHSQGAKDPIETTGPDSSDETEPETTAPTDPDDTPDTTTPEVTRPSDSDPDEGLVEPDTPEQPDGTRPPNHLPDPTVPAPSEPDTDPTEPDLTMGYEQFMALSGAEQREFMESFDSMEAFFDWYNAVKEQYEKDHPAIDVGDGVFDFGTDFG